MHQDYEPLVVTRRTESADKSDALQTLRAVRRRSAVAKRLECVRLQRRFPKVACDSMVGSVHGVKKTGCYPPWAAADIKPATQPRNNEIEVLSPQINGARTIVIKIRAGKPVSYTHLTLPTILRV